MIRIFAIQAKFGDCFLIAHGEKGNSKFLLIDGGPATVFEEHLKPSLDELMNGQVVLDDIVVSHIDNDHIIGVLDLLAKMEYERVTEGNPFLRVDQLWFNSFARTITTDDIEKRTTNIRKVAGLTGVKMTEMAATLTGINEGNGLVNYAHGLNIEMNRYANGEAYLAKKDLPVITKDDLEIRVVGPTVNNLDKLKEEWEDWLKENEKYIARGKFTKEVAANLDRSVPNLSSIVLLIKADNKTYLFTGDCRSDHLLQGLEETGNLVDGKLHVNLLKVPHHGSKRNTSLEFFQKLTADTYLISADGKYGNPDFEVLSWIVESARDSGRLFKIVFTNETPSTKLLMQTYSPEALNFEVEFMKPNAHWLEVIV